MEERVARLESHVEHIQTDITEIKDDVRRVDQKVDSLKDSIVEFRLSVEKGFSKLRLWGLTLYIALAAGLLGVMAKGFGWIQ